MRHVRPRAAVVVAADLAAAVVVGAVAAAGAAADMAAVAAAVVAGANPVGDLGTFVSCLKKDSIGRGGSIVPASAFVFGHTPGNCQRLGRSVVKNGRKRYADVVG